MPDIVVILDGFFEASVSEESLAELQMDFSFDNFSPNPQFLERWVMEFQCTGDAKDPINFIDNHIAEKGIYNNIPAQIIDRKTGLEIFTGHANLSAADATYDFDKKFYNIPFENKNNTFFDLAGAFNLRSLANNDSVADAFRIRTTDFNRVQTVINSVPDFYTAAITSIVIFIMAKEIVTSIKELAKSLADNANVPTGPVVSGLKILIVAIYVTAIMVAIVLMLMQISEALFSKPRDYFVMNIETLLRKACGHLGFTFTSTLFAGDLSQLVILPSTRTEGAIRGNPRNNPIPDQTLLEFLEGIGTLFNAKIKVKRNNVVEFENRETFIGDPSDFILTGLKQQGTTRFNFNELPQNINIRFIRDPVEANTYLSIAKLGINIAGEPVNTEGDSITVSYNITEIEGDNSPFKTDLKIQIPFARGYGKEFQTDTEQLFNGLYDLVNKVGQVFGKSNNNKDGKLGDRLRRLLLNYNAVGAPKVFIIDGKLVSKKNFSLMHAETIYNNFYECESPVENQWQIIEGRADQPVCNTNDIAKILDNNVVLDPDRRNALLQLNKRNDVSMHEITYRIRLEAGDVGFIPADKFTITINSDG